MQIVRESVEVIELTEEFELGSEDSIRTLHVFRSETVEEGDTDGPTQV